MDLEKDKDGKSKKRIGKRPKKSHTPISRKAKLSFGERVQAIKDKRKAS